MIKPYVPLSQSERKSSQMNNIPGAVEHFWQNEVLQRENEMRKVVEQAHNKTLSQFSDQELKAECERRGWSMQ